ncbi:MAG: FAD:protein FMN transferase [Bradyrhizobium sp.]
MPIVSDRTRRARPLLGTFVEIEVTATAGPETDAAIDAAFEAVAQVHRLMSFHDRNSDVSRVNREAGIRPTQVHAWTFEVLEAAVEMHQLSGGAFDITIAPVLKAMGLLPGPDGDLVTACEQRVEDAIELLPEQAIRLRSPGVAIDLGGIAKGFAVDRALEALRCFNISGGLVNAGGDLRTFGQQPYPVHLRDPNDPLRLLARLDLTDEALASSARRFDLIDGATPDTPAIIDPATGKPTTAVIGATVRAPTCMVADALTKVVMVSGTGAGDLLERYRANAMLISADGDVQMTSDWLGAAHRAA